MTESNKKSERKIVRIESHDLPTYYINNVELRAMQWDFRFLMGEVVTSSEEGLEVRDRVQIYMSPQHAKVFAALIARQVAKYESLIGPISVQPEGENES